MKKFYILLIALFMASGVMAQSAQPCSTCLPEGITFYSQAEINNFQTNYPNCTEIEGGVIISGSDITNINGLSVLTSIEGGLEIIYNVALTSLTGLEGITAIGILDIRNNDALTSLTGLDNLDSIGGELGIGGNAALTSLSGLEGVTSIGGDLFIYSNYALTSLTGLEGLTSIGGDLLIQSNIALTSLTGLEGVTSIGGLLSIYYNDALTSLTGLDNIAAGSISYLYIGGNYSLSACAVQSICDYLTNGGYSEIESNATGCNSPTEVDSACVYLSTDEINIQPAFSIYPNPATTTITISTPTTNYKNTFMTIYSADGKQLIWRQIMEEHTVVDVSGLVQGVYFVRVADDRTVMVGKLVKQ